MIRVVPASTETGEEATPPHPAEIPDRVLERWQMDLDFDREIILTYVPEAEELTFEDAMRLAVERSQESALRLEEAALAAVEP